MHLCDARVFAACNLVENKVLRIFHVEMLLLNLVPSSRSSCGVSIFYILIPYIYTYKILSSMSRYPLGLFALFVTASYRYIPSPYHVMSRQGTSSVTPSHRHLFPWYLFDRILNWLRLARPMRTSGRGYIFRNLSD